MIRWKILLGLLLAAFALGCGGNKDKGINRDKDKPVPAKRWAR